MSWRSGLTVERSPSDIVCRYVGVADVRLGARVNVLKLSVGFTTSVMAKLIPIGKHLSPAIITTQDHAHRSNTTIQVASVHAYSP